MVWSPEAVQTGYAIQTGVLSIASFPLPDLEHISFRIYPVT